MGEYTKEYSKIVGYTVQSITRDDESFPGCELYGLVFTKGKQKRIAWVLRDLEGNGDGFLDIEEVQ